MNIKPIKTHIIRPGQITLIDLVDQYIDVLDKGSVVCISSKIVSLCENNVLDPKNIDFDKVVKNETQFYLDRDKSKYNSMLTIAQNTLIGVAGIDKSNSDNTYVLWPTNPIASAKEVYNKLRKKFNLNKLGVIIVDSCSRPLRLGTVGTSLAHFGFNELNDYRGSKDLFDREITVSRSNIAESIATASVMAMGEGREQTPLAVITDIKNIQFGSSYSGTCYEPMYNQIEDDLFFPIISSVNWKTGKKAK